MKPVIALSPEVNAKRGHSYLSHEYTEGILSAGGLPLILPLTSDEDALSRYAQLCDGLLLTGGHDIAPSLYGEESLPACGPLAPERDEMERRLFSLFLEQEKPILGICRGIQMINALLGGTLWQDMPSQCPSTVEHNQQPPYHIPVHQVTLIPGTPLHSLLETETLSVNSYHHQAVKSPAPVLQVMALAPDGIVEALCHPEHPFLWALQWHPEALRDEAHGRKVLNAFVSACR